jgi:hypothetical protein
MMYFNIITLWNMKLCSWCVYKILNMALLNVSRYILDRFRTCLQCSSAWFITFSKYVTRVWFNSSGLWHRVELWVDTNILEKHIVSIFSPEDGDSMFSEMLVSTYNSAVLKMESVCFSETLVSTYKSMGRHNPEEQRCRLHCHENLKSHRVWVRFPRTNLELM